MSEKIEKNRLAILRTLGEFNVPTSSQKITEYLNGQGHSFTERTVRFHLLALDKEGLTVYVGRQGRRLTETGRQELAKARVYEKVGFLNARIDEMTCLMSFDPARRAGRVIINLSVMKIEDFERACRAMEPVFEAGFSMGSLVCLFGPGEKAGGGVVPRDHLAIGTVSFFNMNGVMVRDGIPTYSVFGGLLEIMEHRPQRFVEIIKYAGTSIEPLEIFIKSGMTDLTGAAGGNVRAGGNFMELPSVCREAALEISGKMDAAGLGRILLLGWPGQNLLEIPLNAGRIGCVLLGGLNPIAAAAEKGVPVNSRAAGDLVDYGALFPYRELPEQFRRKI